MAGISLMAFGALLFAVAFLSLTRSQPDKMISFILRFKELNRNFKTKNGENIHTKALFEDSRYVRKQILDYNLKFFSNLGAILFGAVAFCIFGSFFLMVMHYESGLKALFIITPILIVGGIFISKRMLMKLLVSELEKNSENIEVSLVKEATE